MLYLQLLSGTDNFFINLPIQKFRWIEQGWLTSLWKFISEAGLELVYPAQWLPPLPREGDLYLMGFFSSSGSKATEMTALNRCWLYLQAFTLSDIVATNSCTIL